MFDTDVNRRIILPLFRYPDCVRDYEIAVRSGSGWKTLIRESGNYFRRRVHKLENVSTDGLRLTVATTNGAGSARIYSLRVYNESRLS
jgi:hypothetical protein